MRIEIDALIGEGGVLQQLSEQVQDINGRVDALHVNLTEHWSADSDTKLAFDEIFARIRPSLTNVVENISGLGLLVQAVARKTKETQEEIAQAVRSSIG